MTKKTNKQTTPKNTHSPAIKKSDRPPKTSKRDSPEPAPNESSSEGKIEEISDSQSERSPTARPQIFTPNILSKSQVQEIVALTMPADRKAVSYIVMFADRKEKKLRRKVICTNKDMHLLEEKQKKRYRMDYLVSYLRSHREQD